MRASLHRLLLAGDHRAGFLLPVFRAHASANLEYVQSIGVHDRVLELEPCWFEQGTPIAFQGEHPIAVGLPALWAFSDGSEQPYIGTAEEIRRIGRVLLSSGRLDEFPLVAAEMVLFCQAELEYPDMLRTAFNTIKGASKTGAALWRDTAILLPSLRRDVAEELGSQYGTTSTESMMLVSRGGTARVYTPRTIFPKAKPSTRSLRIAKVFGIRHVEFREYSKAIEPSETLLPSWLAVGIGGAARYVLTKAPFKGVSRSGFPEIVAVGPTESKPRAPAGRLFVAIVASNSDEARALSGFSRKVGFGEFTRHAINIRPIGFGTPSVTKATPIQMREAFSGFDGVWLVTNHRQRQTARHYNALAASTVASRFARAASLGLIATMETEGGWSLLQEQVRLHGIGLIGASRYEPAAPEEDMLAQVLHTMLCEDALLHTARQIWVLHPNPSVEGIRRGIRLGAHEFKVRLIRWPKAYRQNSLVAFAAAAELGRNTDHEYKDFCRSLLFGYGWELHHDNGINQIYRRNGDHLRVWTTRSKHEILAQVQRPVEFPFRDIILTGRSVTKTIREAAQSRGWKVIHHSEVFRMMRDEYGLALMREY